jgi:uncharacterized membrane protein (TIGR02234 family)
VTTERGRRGRQLGVVAILAVAGAALAAVAAALTWWSADYLDPLSGAVTIEATGGATVPELIPLALVGLAGFGAALATHGVFRRVIGVVISLCGLGIAIRSGMSFATEPGALVEQLTRPADRVGGATVHPLGPVLAVVGGLLLAAAGVLVVLGLGARQRMSSRYDRTTGTPAAGRPTENGTRSEDTTDPSDWWKALDAGADPTIVDSSAQNVTAPDSTEHGVRGAETRPGDSTSGIPAEYPPTVSEHTSGDGYHDPNASRPS